MDAGLIAWAVAGLFLAGVVKGATGLGYSSCALPFLVAALGLKPAMSLVLVPAMATNVAVALTTGHLSETVRRFLSLYLAMIPGIAIGIGLLMWIDPAVAVKALGGIVIGYVVWTARRPSVQLSSLAAARLQVPTGLLNGVLTGLTGSQVMPLFPYMFALDLDSDRMVQAINFAVLICSVILGAGLLAAGIMTLPLLYLSLVAVLPALIGVRLGTWLRALIPAERFRGLVLTVLLVMGATMVLR